MSVEIKSLTLGSPGIAGTQAAQNDNFNMIPAANVVYDLYTASKADNNKKAAVVKCIRIFNTSPTATVKLTLYFNRPNANGEYRRRQLTPPDVPLPPGFEYIDDDEISLEPGDSIQAKADTAGVIQYLISGLERDVV